MRAAFDQSHKFTHYRNTHVSVFSLSGEVTLRHKINTVTVQKCPNAIKLSIRYPKMKKRRKTTVRKKSQLKTSHNICRSQSSVRQSASHLVVRDGHLKHSRVLRQRPQVRRCVAMAAVSRSDDEVNRSEYEIAGVNRNAEGVGSRRLFDRRTLLWFKARCSPLT